MLLTKIGWTSNGVPTLGIGYGTLLQQRRFLIWVGSFIYKISVAVWPPNVHVADGKRNRLGLLQKEKQGDVSER